MAGIEGTKALLKLVEEVLDAYKEASADGKINIFDLPKAAGLLPELRAVAASGKMVPVELKDLDAAELSALLEQMVLVFEKAVAAFIPNE